MTVSSNSLPADARTSNVSLPEASPDDTIVASGSSAAIIDASGNRWTISNGAVDENGAAAGYSSDVAEIAYVNGTVWQENASHLWWHWDGSAWAGTGSSASPLPGASTPLPLGSASNPLKVMPMGDSMTASGGTAYNGGPPPGGYRAPLYAGLTAAGFAIQYVGDQTSNPGGGLPANEDNHEGIGGYSIETVNNSTVSPGLLNYIQDHDIQDHDILQTYKPDVILLDIGYNNIYVAAPENVGPTQAFDFLQQMVSYIFQQLPNVKLLVGTVPASGGDSGVPTSDPNSSSEIGYYNHLILTQLASAINNPNLSIVDVNGAENAYTGPGGVASLIGPDGVHPSVAGFQVMAGAWQAGLEKLAGSSSGALPAPKISPNDTVVTAGSTAAITDASGNQWTISNGVVNENGAAAGYSAGVTEIAYVNGTVWQENAGHLWWNWSGTGWAGSGTSTSPLPATPDTLTLRVAEDAYQGDAQFSVSVDGQQVGATLTASALHAAGASNVFSLTGNWGQGVHDVKIQFLNDAYGGSAAADRNLYVTSVGYDGQTYAGTSAGLMTNGAKDFTVGGGTATASPPADTLTLHLAEDAWNGDARFIVSVDGKTLSTAQAVTASHAAGAWQDFTFSGNFGAGTHDVGISFTNDAYGGSAATDRNLYVNGVDFDGAHYGSGATALHGDGIAHFTV